MKQIVLILLLVLGAGSWFFFSKSTEKTFMELKYIVTETKGPDSFDPINADKTQNITIMRMLYATPLEVDRSNSLNSKILESFQYLREKNQIIFEVRDDQKYSDGTVMTAEDVALAIARMAYNRPQFPVIKDIEGVQAWADLKKGLAKFPSGIKLEGQKVVITLTRASANPLFRFCLELFSVIPAKCLDKETGKLICDLPPASGYFSLKTSSPEEYTFERRSDQNSVDPIPFQSVRFSFKKLADACRTELASNEVISGVELDFLATDCSKKLSREQVHWMPSARFGVLRFNPQVAPFTSKEGRYVFSETVREIMRRKNESLLVERGLFSRLIPGYIENKILEFNIDVGTRNSFKGMKITLPQMQHSGLKIVFDSIIEAAQVLGMVVHLTGEPTNEILLNDFLKGSVPVVAGASGFWAQDPIGDVSMWFTPNLHKTMSFVWPDGEIYKQIEDLEAEIDPLEIRNKMEKFNLYISEQSILAPVVHFRRLFISSKHITKLNLPQAVTAPAPWQLVPVE